MFYDALENRHGLPHDPWKSLMVPRPVGWISTVSRDGKVNLAPYSFFNALGDDPHYVYFASGGRKHSLKNAEETGEFVCVLATYDLREQMNATSAAVDYGIDEMRLAGLTPTPSRLVKPPRVAESPVAFECRYHATLSLPGRPGSPKEPYHCVVGLVVGIYIDDRVIKDGRIDIPSIKPIARLGYMDYSVVTAESMFAMDRPAPADLLKRR